MAAPVATRARVTAFAALAVLMLLSVSARTDRLGVGFWIDEALSVGIADRPLGDIPGALRLDGSPPLYYMLLHVWLKVTGSRTEETTHLLSLILATATIPVAWALVRALTTERVAWCAAILFAVNPFLTRYAQETRMYALVILLGTVACATFAGAFVFDRGRRWSIGFVASTVALLYTHNWALFFGAATGLAWLVLAARDRALLRRGAFLYGAIALAYAPWLPALLFQARHTGAPWANPPEFETLVHTTDNLLTEPALAALLVAAAVTAPRLLRDPRGRAIAALAGIAVVTVVLAWVSSQASPAWATRYLAIAVPPLLLAAAGALDRAGRVGMIALAVACAFSLSANVPKEKSNVRVLASAIAPTLRAGDTVISTQPEQAPALAYYLDDVPGLRWGTIFGPLDDLGVTDWRDGVKRMERLTPEHDLVPLLDSAPIGSRVALVEPEIYALDRWRAPWTQQVRIRSTQWRAWMLDDPRFRVVAVRPEEFVPPAPNPLRATVFLKVGMG
jgi:hypothetical protein